MTQLLTTLALVGLMVYFLFFRAPTDKPVAKPPTAYSAEIEQAKAVEQQLQQAVQQRQSEPEQ